MNIQGNLASSYRVYKEFEDILNSYVSDYYHESHWNKLPKSWQKHFINIEMKPLSEFLNLSKPTGSLEEKMYPLSLLCLRELLICNTLPRTEMSMPSSLSAFEGGEDFMNIFWKGVKLKKRHEITRYWFRSGTFESNDGIWIWTRSMYLRSRRVSHSSS